MQFFSEFGWNPYALVVLAIVYFSSRRGSQSPPRDQRLFYGLLAFNAIILAVEMLTRSVNGVNVAGARLINEGSNAALFALNPAPALFWLLYVEYQIHGKSRFYRTIHVVGIAVVVVHGIAALLSPATGLLFSISDDNIYQRGPGYGFTAALNFGSILFAAAYLIHHRRIFAGKQFYSMFLFPIFPGVAAVVQVALYEPNVIWSALTLSVFLVYINVQNTRINTDYLTGLPNRRQLDEALVRRVQSRGEPFGVIMVDLDDFKTINDNHGHKAGDEALRAAGQIFRAILRRRDMVGRYGGDEFVALITATSEEEVKQTANRLKLAAEEFNSASGAPFRLRFSIGYGLYREGETPDQIVTRIDNKMYEEKNRRKNRRSGAYRRGEG